MMRRGFFGFNGMDDEFERFFMKFLTMNQPKLEDFFKKTYLNESVGDKLNTTPIFSGLNEKDLSVERGTDENGEWEKRSWVSPDGTSSFISVTRTSINPSSEKVDDNKDDIHTINLLQRKLDNFIKEEKYEDAAKIRDLIKSIKDGIDE